MSKTNYSVIVEVRDKDGKIFKNSNGNPQPDFKFDLNCTPDKVEYHARTYARTLKAWMPENKLNISIHTFNEFTKTWPCDFSFYVEEDRFIEHK